MGGGREARFRALASDGGERGRVAALLDADEITRSEASTRGNDSV